jgi:flagellar motility protein MotE (MotC chaperone)
MTRRRHSSSRPFGPELHSGLALALWLVAACGRVADARLDDAGSEEAGTDGEPAHDSDADDDELDDEAPLAQPELDSPTAEAEIDAAIAAARAHGEEDRLALARERHELDALTKELDERLAGIDALEQRLDALVGVGKVAEDRRRERVEVLATLLATMPPQAAATMLAQMSEVEAQELVLSVSQTDKRKAAKLIATMPAPRAAAIGQGYLRRDPKALVGEAATTPTTTSAATRPAEPAAAEASTPTAEPEEGSP